MQVGLRYVVTRSSKNKEFIKGDVVWMNKDGSVMCPNAKGFMVAENVKEATRGWSIEIIKPK